MQATTEVRKRFKWPGAGFTHKTLLVIMAELKSYSYVELEPKGVAEVQMSIFTFRQIQLNGKRC
jgi:hypothetical protein